MTLDEWLMQPWLWGTPTAILISYAAIILVIGLGFWWVLTRTRYQWYYYIIALIGIALFVDRVLHVQIPIITEIAKRLIGG